jgi:HK97 gp10 family phage protein
MSKTVNIILIGSGELRQKLQGLTDKESKAVIRGATREALKPIQRSAQDLAPKKTGRLRRSIRIRSLTRTKKKIGSRITISKKDNQYTGRTFYGAFQEFGWKPGKRLTMKAAIAGATRDSQKVPPKEFMRRSAKNGARDAVTLFNSIVSKHIQKVMSKRK